MATTNPPTSSGISTSPWTPEPLLVVACPLSMLAMGVGMARASKHTTRDDGRVTAPADAGDGALR